MENMGHKSPEQARAEQNLLAQFIGTQYGEMKKLDDDVIDPMKHLNRTGSHQMKQMFTEIIQTPPQNLPQPAPSAHIPAELDKALMEEVVGPTANLEIIDPEPNPVGDQINLNLEPSLPQGGIEIKKDDNQMELDLFKTGEVNDVFQRLTVIEDMVYEIKKNQTEILKTLKQLKDVKSKDTKQK